MISIYRDYFMCPKTQPIYGKEREHYQQELAILRLFLKNVQLAAKNFQEYMFSAFDPVAKDYACEIRAHYMMVKASNPALHEEMKKLEITVKDLLEKQNELCNKLGDLGALELKVSPQIDFLLRAHLLTVGREAIKKANGETTSQINISTMSSQLSKAVSHDRLRKIIEVAREEMNRLSIEYFQPVMERYGAKILSEFDPQVMPRLIKKIQYTADKKSDPLNFLIPCALYKFKTLWELVLLQNIPIMVQEFSHTSKKELIQLYFEPSGLMLTEEKIGQLPPHHPILKIKAICPEEMTQEKMIEALKTHSLFAVIMANFAQLPQYYAHDDISDLPIKAREEISYYRGVANDLIKVFKIIHMHASTKEQK